MKNQIILWLSSIVIVFIIGYIKNVTDEDYPITSTFGIEGKKVSYKLDKISYNKSSYKNVIISDIEGLKGKLIWIKDDVIHEAAYKEIERGLECEIPRLQAGQNIKYKVILNYRDKFYEIPEQDYVTLTFWGNIPSPVNILDFIFLYGGLLMSIRCLLELFNKSMNLKKFSVMTCALFIGLVTIISPLKNSYKLGAINHFVPHLTDLIEPALILILFLWIVGSVFIFTKKYTTAVTILITSITVLLFFSL
jgi:hypothetical protein